MCRDIRLEDMLAQKHLQVISCCSGDWKADLFLKECIQVLTVRRSPLHLISDQLCLDTNKYLQFVVQKDQAAVTICRLRECEAAQQNEQTNSKALMLRPVHFNLIINKNSYLLHINDGRTNTTCAASRWAFFYVMP